LRRSRDWEIGIRIRIKIRRAVTADCADCAEGFYLRIED